MAKQPAHRPPSAIDLARSLQRIEAAAGYPRTVIAVEGDRVPSPVPRTSGGEPDPDLTQVKPVSVVSALGPAVGPSAGADAVAAIPREPRRPAPGGRRCVARSWRGPPLAVVAMVAVVTALLVTGGEPSDPQVRPTSSPSTPQGVAPEAPTGVPIIDGRRDPDEGWSSPG